MNPSKLFIMANTFRVAKRFAENHHLEPGTWQYLRHAFQLQGVRNAKILFLGNPLGVEAEQLMGLSDVIKANNHTLITKEEL